MSTFDERWKIAAAASRAAEPPPTDEAPPGFATRVVAQWRAGERPFSIADLWQQLAWRTLGGAVLALLLAVIADRVLGDDPDALAPDIAGSMTEVLWQL